MCALESSATLLNCIHRLHQGLKPGERPSRAVISDMFQSYQEQRKPRMKQAFDASAQITRMQAYDGAINHFAMRCVFPVQGMATYADQLGELCSTAPKFDFLPVRYTKPATIKWKDEADHIPTKPTSLGKSKRGSLFMDLASLLSLLLIVFSVFGRQSTYLSTTPGVSQKLLSDLGVVPDCAVDHSCHELQSTSSSTIV